ncbi:hypothetical protein GGR50DRAFT_426371 [Xylaria sp. CBS 124048]|nr:hypothetical protein GGR50DRAFT_426371 [Xylaria sp. CBS 124048]
MSSDGSDGRSLAFGYILIPLIGFGLIVSLLTCCRYRRKKRQIARLTADPAYVRDVEAGRRPAEDVPLTSTTGDTRRHRATGRRLGVGVGSAEEGLNELGEAPPAYTPNVPKPPGAEGSADHGLATYSQAAAEVGTSWSPPQYGDVLPPPAFGTTGGTREEVATTGTTSEPTAPPRAVLRPS